MPHERVVLLEDNDEHAVALCQDMLREGYQLDVVKTIEEATQLIATGVRKAIIDLRLFGPGDNSGLRAVGRIKRLFPSAFVVVCSIVASDLRGWAVEEGADAVVTKRPRQMRATALEIVNHFLRHDGGRRMTRFAAAWVGLPLIAGVTGSWVLRKASIMLPLMTQAGSALLPLVAAFLFILTVTANKARDEPSISNKRVFLEFLAFRGWLITALAGGVIYDVLKRMFGW
jgi:CheY-like chemotaxis protein